MAPGGLYAVVPLASHGSGRSQLVDAWCCEINGDLLHHSAWHGVSSSIGLIQFLYKLLILLVCSSFQYVYVYNYYVSTPVQTFDDFAVVVGNYTCGVMYDWQNEYDRNHLKEIING